MNLAPSRTQGKSFAPPLFLGPVPGFLGERAIIGEVALAPVPRPWTEVPVALLSGFSPYWITMKLHRKSVLSFFHEFRTQAPDQEGILLKKGARNTSYQRRWFILRGNLLFYLEHQADHTPLGLILLENCQVEPCLKATEPYAFTILTPGIQSACGRAYKLAAENQEELEAWLCALAGVSWRRLDGLLSLLEAQYRELCQAAGQKPNSPLKNCDFVATLSAPSCFQELHERFGKEIRMLKAVHRGLQASDKGGSRAQANLEQELNQCLLISD
ncbi:sesquipedalian-1-like isoform X1 [Marmota monax]|nr:sesquipedalian-1-like [Marmota flaviventris]XP_046310375.1 sesquipedalian-1-like isoform X1 [Marmota monax]